MLAFSAAALLSAAGAALLASATSAVVAYKFIDPTRRGGEAPRKLPRAADMLVARSDKAAVAASLWRRVFFALMAAFSWLAAQDFLSLCGAGGGDFPTRGVVGVAAVAAAFFLQYAVFDLAAERFGTKKPEKTLSSLAHFFAVCYILSVPFVLAARKISSRLFSKRLFGGKVPKFKFLDVEVMLRAEDADADAISPYAGKIVRNAIRLSELDVSDAMIPRSVVVYFDTSNSMSENISLARSTRHTRYPLCHGDLDNCVGLVHLKDLFMGGGDPSAVDLMSIKRETMRLKENDKLESALAKMLRYNLHMALVEDEFGGVIGVLTLDAALGELVGKIRDEFNANEKDNSLRVVGKNLYKISGRAPLRKVEDFLDVDFDNDKVSTFGGLITGIVGRFPEKGEIVRLRRQRLVVRIDEVGEKSVGECTVESEPDPDSERKPSGAAE